MIATLTNALLVVAYNQLAAATGLDAVKRFSDRKVGAKRVQDLVDKLVASGKVVSVGEDGAVAVADPAPVAPVAPAPVASEKPAAPVAPAAKPAAKGGAKSPSVADSDVIYVLAPSNPKKGTAAERYNNYRDGLAVEAYIAAVGDRRQGLRDIAWDLRKGWIEVIGAAAARKREKAKLAAAEAASAPAATAQAA